MICIKEENTYIHFGGHTAPYTYFGGLTQGLCI